VRRRGGERSKHPLAAPAFDDHNALEAAFGWDDDRLYSSWLKGKFWACDGSEYTYPFHAAQPNPLGPFAIGPAPRSADVRLGRLELRKGKSPTTASSNRSP